MAKAKSPKYIPGVCNIGPSERAKRRQAGIYGVIITAIVLDLLIMTHEPKGWRLVLILPASAAASGYLQDTLHFCAGFGMKGLYNVVSRAGITNNVESEEFRRKDRRKAQMIIGLSLLVGIVFAGICYFV